MKQIKLVIDDETLKEYDAYYFSNHRRCKKRPIPHPYHESINKWMIMKRPAMNALKQRWKEFVVWFVAQQGLSGLQIDRCELWQTVFYPTNHRHDIDNTVPKFIIDGLVESGMIVDDDCNHVTRLVLQCGSDKAWPRTEIIINKLDKRDNEAECKEEIQNGC